MHIKIATQVAQDYDTVYERFDRDLFEALAPPLMPLKLLRFDGSRTGDEVHIAIGPIRWHALIVDHGRSATENYFVDKGTVLPFFLKTWEHRHRILKDGSGSIIVDDIRYTTPFGKVGDLLFYPSLYAQFAMRKPVYRRYFGVE